MPSTDYVYIFGNDGTGDALLDASCSKISIYRRLRLLFDPATNEGQNPNVQRWYCPPKQVMSRGTIPTVRCAGDGMFGYHSLLNGCSLHDGEVRIVIITTYLPRICGHECTLQTRECQSCCTIAVSCCPITHYLLHLRIYVMVHLPVCINIDVCVVVNRCLPAELQVLSTPCALPCLVTCRHEPLRTPNTFLALFTPRTASSLQNNSTTYYRQSVLERLQWQMSSSTTSPLLLAGR